MKLYKFISWLRNVIFPKKQSVKDSFSIISDIRRFIIKSETQNEKRVQEIWMNIHTFNKLNDTIRLKLDSHDETLDSTVYIYGVKIVIKTHLVDDEFYLVH